MHLRRSMDGSGVMLMACTGQASAQRLQRVQSLVTAAGWRWTIL